MVISHRFWERRFAADPSVIGRTVHLLPGRGERWRCTIIGVLPAGFRFTYPLETEVWRLLPWTRVVPSRALEFEMIARLKPDAAPRQAEAELTTVAHDIGRAWGLPDDFVRDQAALVETVAEHAAGEARSGVRSSSSSLSAWRWPRRSLRVEAHGVVGAVVSREDQLDVP